MIRPLRSTFRKLLRTPVFTVTAVLTLALGVGTSTAVFSVVNGILLSPLPFDDSDRLLAMWHTAPGLDLLELTQSPATYLTYRDDSRLLEDIAIWAGRSVTVDRPDNPEQVGALLVTEDFLDVLRVAPALGRDFGPEDDRPGAPETVLVSHGFWQRALGGSATAVGSTIPLSGTPREIIGVLPEDFRFLDRDPQILYPAQFDPANVFMGQFSYNGIARMRPGVVPEQVAAELQGLSRVAVDRYPGPFTMSMVEQARFAPDIRLLKEDFVGNLRPLLWILLGTVGLVLVIACANVANLFLVRAEARSREVAVRVALGAGRAEVASIFVTEALVLSGAAGFVGLFLAYGGVELLRWIGPGQLPRLDEVAIDPTAVLFAAMVSVVSGLAFGLLALSRHGRTDVTATLKDGGRGGSRGREARRIRSGLIVGQVAIALVLLIGSGLMVRSLLELRGVSPGFAAPDELLRLGVTIPETLIEDPFQAFAVHERMLREIAEVPGVVSAAGSSAVPMDGSESFDAVFVESRPTEPGGIPPVRRFVFTTPGHFETMGIPMLAGRDLGWDDIAVRRRAVLVNRSMADVSWGSAEEAIGERVSVLPLEGGERVWFEVVGVVGDVHDEGLDQAVVPMVYWPAAADEIYGDGPEVERGLTYVVRTDPNRMDEVLDRVRAIVTTNAPGVPIAGVGTLGELVDRSLARRSFALVMLGTAASVAMLLGVIGLYGVVSYAVSQRRREIGIRMALGARAGAVGGMIVREGLSLAGIGVALGIVGAVGLTRLMSSLLYGVSPADAPTYLAAAAVLTGFALVATWIPARRAAGFDPAVTLRED